MIPVSFLKILFLFEVLALLILIKNFNKYPFTYIFFLFLILISTVLTECLSMLFMAYKIKGFNVHCYYSFILFNSISLSYFEVIKSKRNKVLIKVLAIVFSLSWVIHFFMIDFLLNYLLILGALNTSILAFAYLKELLMSNNIINYRKILPFWVSVSFLVFYMSVIPFFLIQKYMNDRSFYHILYFLGVMMYSGIIYGLITCNKEEKY